MSLRLVLLGPPGAGKGTLAKQLEERLSITHLSTGDIFRREIGRGSALGKTVSRYVAQGRLVPDEVVVKVMTSQLSTRILTRGFVLDGFPRTVGQARGLEAFLLRRKLPLDGAVALECPSSMLVARLSGRRVCAQCGAIYHVRTMRPKRAGRCDRCGGALVVRKDDRVATIKKRLAIDRAQAAPLLAFYRRNRRLVSLDATGSSEQVFRRTMTLFRRQDWLKSVHLLAG